MSKDKKPTNQDDFSLKRAAGRGLLMPLQVANKGTRNSARMIKDSFKHRPVLCPVCITGHYQLLQKGDKQLKSINSVWICDCCSHEVVTKSSSVKELADVVKNNSSSFYKLGQEMGYVQPLEKELADKAIKRLLFRSKLISILVLILLFILPLYIAKASYLSAVNVLLAIVFLTTLALHASFSAFKIHNDLFYAPNHSAILLMWLKKCEYFKVWDYKPKQD